MVSFAIPLTDFRVEIRRPIPHLGTESHKHPHGHDELEDLLLYIAYYDENDRIARAVCPALSIVVERPTVEQSALEIERVIAGAIEDAEAEHEDIKVVARALPTALLMEHLTRFSKMLERRADQKGIAWLSGHRHLHSEEIPA
jgi:hypothetical protein